MEERCVIIFYGFVWYLLCDPEKTNTADSTRASYSTCIIPPGGSISIPRY